MSALPKTPVFIDFKVIIKNPCNETGNRRLGYHTCRQKMIDTHGMRIGSENFTAVYQMKLSIAGIERSLCVALTNN